MEPANQEADNYLMGIILSVAAIALSTITAFRLVANKDIKNY